MSSREREPQPNRAGALPSWSTRELQVARLPWSLILYQSGDGESGACSLKIDGIALISTVELRQLELARSAPGCPEVVLGVALISTVGLRLALLGHVV